MNRNEYLILGGSFVGGAVVGFVGTRMVLKAKYLAISEKEIAEAKVFYSALNKADYATATDAAEDLLVAGAVKALKLYEGDRQSDYVPVTTESIQDVIEAAKLSLSPNPVAVEEVRNVFDTQDAPNVNWDYDEELANRTSDAPYVISYDEWAEAGPNYIQSSLTHYLGDDVLADDKDMPIEDVDGTVGQANLEKFGHGSNDNNVVYIRNDQLEIDFEVGRSKGEFAQEVMGLRHSEDFSRRPMKFRRYDE